MIKIPTDIIYDLSNYLSNLELYKLKLFSDKVDISSENFWNRRVADTIYVKHDLELIRTWNVDNKWKLYYTFFGRKEGNVIYASGVKITEHPFTYYHSHIGQKTIDPGPWTRWEFVPIHKNNNIYSICDHFYLKDGDLYELDMDKIIAYVTPVKKIYKYKKPLIKLKKCDKEIYVFTIDGKLMKISNDDDHKYQMMMIINLLNI